MVLRTTAILFAALALAGCQNAEWLCQDPCNPPVAQAPAPQNPCDPCAKPLLAAVPLPEIEAVDLHCPCGPTLRRSQLTLNNFDAEWLAPHQPFGAFPKHGTTLVEGVLNRNPWLHREVNFTGSFGDGDEELEVSAEWAFTRRLGVYASLPFNLDDDWDVDSFTFGGKALLLDQEISDRTLLVTFDTPFTVSNSGDTWDWSPVLSASYEAGWGVNLLTNIGVDVNDGRKDYFRWTAGISRECCLGPLGNWGFIAEGGTVNNDWIGSFGFNKGLDVLGLRILNNASLQAYVVQNFDTDDTRGVLNLSFEL